MINILKLHILILNVYINCNCIRSESTTVFKNSTIVTNASNILAVSTSTGKTHRPLAQYDTYNATALCNIESFISEDSAFIIKLSANDYLPPQVVCQVFFQGLSSQHPIFYTFHDIYIDSNILLINNQAYYGNQTIDNENDNSYMSHDDMVVIDLVLRTSTALTGSSFTIVATSYRNAGGPCNSDEFTCKNGRCISKQYFCDTHNNCGDRSDEECDSLLGACHPNDFTCKNGRCISKQYVCDTHNNCGDQSDEECDSCKTHRPLAHYAIYNATALCNMPSLISEDSAFFIKLYANDYLPPQFVCQVYIQSLSNIFFIFYTFHDIDIDSNILLINNQEYHGNKTIDNENDNYYMSQHDTQVIDLMLRTSTAFTGSSFTIVATSYRNAGGKKMAPLKQIPIVQPDMKFYKKKLDNVTRIAYLTKNQKSRGQEDPKRKGKPEIKS